MSLNREHRLTYLSAAGVTLFRLPETEGLTEVFEDVENLVSSSSAFCWVSSKSILEFMVSSFVQTLASWVSMLRWNVCITAVSEPGLIVGSQPRGDEHLPTGGSISPGCQYSWDGDDLLHNGNYHKSISTLRNVCSYFQIALWHMQESMKLTFECPQEPI